MKQCTEMAPNGARRSFFLLIQILPTFWAERICIMRISIFPIFWDSRFPDFQIPGFPDSRLSAGMSRGQLAGGAIWTKKRLIFCCEYWCWSSRHAVSCRRDESKCHQVLVCLHQNERRVPAVTSQGPFARPSKPLIASSV